MLDIVHSLVEKSLLSSVSNSRESEPRYRMLETVREFALEKLEASSEAPTVSAAHAAYFLALAEEAEAALDGSSQRLWHDRLEADLPNLRAAVEWAIREEPDLALRLCAALQMFWLVRGHLGEARDVLYRVLSTAGGKPQTRTRALIAAAWITYAQGDMESSVDLADQALALARREADRPGMAGALSAVGYIEATLGPTTVRADPTRFARAAAAFEEQLDLAYQLDDQRIIGSALHALGTLALEMDDPDRATSFLTNALHVCEELGNQRTVAWIRHELGRLAARSSDTVASAIAYRQALHGFLEIRDRWSTIRMIDDVAWLALQSGRTRRQPRSLVRPMRFMSPMEWLTHDHIVTQHSRTRSFP